MNSKDSESTHRLFKDSPYSVFNKLIEGCQIIDRDWKYFYVNDVVAKHGRLPKEQILGRTMMEVYPGIEKTPMFSIVRKCMKDRIPHQMENEFTFPDGSKGRFDLRFQPVPEGVLIFSAEITEHKRAEEDLNANLIKYQTLFESLPIGVTISDKAGNILESNKEAERLLGLPMEEHTKRKIDGLEWHLIRPDGSPMPADEYASVRALKENHLVKDGEMGIVKGEGDVTWINVTAVPIPLEDYGVLIVYNDITKRKRAEEKLRESEDRFKAQYQGSPSPTFTWKKQGEDFVLIDFNDAARAITDGKVGEFVGRKATELYSGRQELLRDFRRCCDQREVIRRETRSEHFVPGRLVVVTFAFVQPDLVLVHLEDITEQKLAEEERYKLQSQLSNAVEIAHLGPWELDFANDLFIFNDHFYKIFRTTAKEVGGYTMSQAEYFRRFVHPDDIPFIEGEMRKGLENADPHFIGQLEHRMFYADGTVGHINARFVVIKDAHGKTVKHYGVNQDITEYKKREEESLRSQKLESLGTLAGGIAHDFNNILTIILGYITMAKMQARPGDEIFEMLSEVETASTRAQAMTRQLLTFAKGGSPVIETASIRDIIKESSLFVLRGSKSRCELSIAEDLWPAEVDVGQINQVINNVVINANQAMPEGGIIRVAAENLIIDNGQGLPLKPGRYIRISITDQGVGIAENHLLHIFDPYFTTKRKGSGLGLAVTYSIIKKHDGHITVESTLGESTTFHIYLPASEKAVPEKEEDGLIKGHGRILVMDDEESLRKMVRKMLKNLGYESEFAKDGAEALEMYKAARESGKPYDAVVLDLTVPGRMGGKDAIKKLFEIDPEVKAVVSSGYSDDPVLSNFREYGFKGILPKPFKSPSLGKVLRDVIRGETE